MTSNSVCNMSRDDEPLDSKQCYDCYYADGSLEKELRVHAGCWTLLIAC